MDWKDFMFGIGSLILAYSMCRWIKGEKPSSKENNWTGPTLKTYYGYWGAIIMLVIFGVVYIIKSLPNHIN
jgi:hypothetical protein